MTLEKLKSEVAIVHAAVNEISGRVDRIEKILESYINRADTLARQVKAEMDVLVAAVETMRIQLEAALKR